MNESISTNKEEFTELITLRTQVAMLKRMAKKEGEIIYAEDINRIFGWENEATEL